MNSHTNPPDSPIGAALAAVRERIDAACKRSGRPASAVRLIAVSKTVSVARILELLAHGHVLLGENRVQEALSKMEQISGASWHLVGHLQRNKARHAVGRFELIHGVDSSALAAELDRRATAAAARQPILVQVNLSRELTKSGVSEEELPALLDTIRPLSSLELRGLMTIPPPVEVADGARGWFERLREVRDRESTRLGLPLSDLSMGMTDDFEAAVEEGATLVRIGRAIFGARG